MAYVADINNEFILGLDFLKENNFKLDFVKNELHSNSEDVAVFNIENSETKSFYQIKAKSDVIISARTETIDPGMLTENDKIHFAITEYPDEENSIKGVLIASSLVHLSRNVNPVRVANVSEKVKHVKKGEVIATCAPVTCIDRGNQTTQFESSESLKNELLKSADLNSEEKLAAERLIMEFKDLFST